MKYRTDIELQEFLDAESAWRLREIDYLRGEVRRATGLRKKPLIRAGVPLLYAHWEGFVKAAAEALLNYVAYQNHLYRELQPCFAARGLAARLHDLAETRQHALRVECLRFVTSSLDTKASFPLKGAVSTKANLSSAVFRDIYASVGLDPSPYATKSKLIDESLLRRRNSIAHGEYLDIEEHGFLQLSDEVLSLIHAVKADVENSVARKSYLEQSVPNPGLPRPAPPHR